MKRACFLCQAQPETLRKATWHLPLLPTQAISYGVCPGCGMVMETESATPQDMQRYYAESAVYTNPGRAGQPTAGKIAGVARAVQMVRDVVGEIPANVFQVGSSDGYTLSEFRSAGARNVTGIDPSPASCQLARELHGIESEVAGIEDYQVPQPMQLWVMTHVLEHLYDPLSVLRQARDNQAAGDWLLVEVPLFERMDLLPPGYLTFEHLNYFCETTLLGSLAEAGYEEVEVVKAYAEDLYPIIRVVARAVEPSAERVFPNVFASNRFQLRRYLEREESEWRLAQDRIHTNLDRGRKAWLWGAGIHSSQLLAATDTGDWLQLRGLIDSSPTRQGQSFGDYRVASAQEAGLKAGDAIVISSRASEAEIYRALSPYMAAGVDVVRLYSDSAPLELSA